MKSLKSLTKDELIFKVKELLKKKPKKVKKVKKVKKAKKEEIKDVLQVNVKILIKVSEKLVEGYGKFKWDNSIRTFKQSFIMKNINASQEEIDKATIKFVDDFTENRYYSTLYKYSIMSTNVIPFIGDIKNLPMYLQNYIENNGYSKWKPMGLDENCVMDFLLEMYNNPRYNKRYTKEKILNVINNINVNDIEQKQDNQQKITDYYEILNKKIIKEGFTINQLKKWCSYTKQNLYVFDATMGVIDIQKVEQIDKNLPSVMFIMSCNHIYPITNISVRKQLLNLISTNNHYVNKTGDEEEIETIAKVMMRNNPDDIFDFVKSLNEKLYIYIHTDDLKDVYDKFIFNKIMPRCYGYDNKITRIEINNINIYANEDLCDSLAAYQEFEIKEPFFNQNLQMILKSIVSKTYGKEFIHSRTSSAIDFKSSCFKLIAPSYRNDRYNILNDIDCIPDDIRVYDLNKAQPSALYNNLDDYPVFYETDNIELYNNEDIKPGFYFIEINEGNLLFQGSQFYPHNLVKYALDKKIITKNQIKYQYIASRTLPFDFFKKIINLIWDSNLCKKLKKKILMNLCGSLYKNNIMKKQKTVFTNDYVEACYLYHKYAGDIIEESANGFFVHYTDFKLREANDAPIYLQMIANTRIALYELYNKIKNDKSELLVVNSDCLVIRGGNNIKENSNVFGGWKLENKLPEKPLHNKPFFLNTFANDDPILKWNKKIIDNKKDTNLIKLVFPDNNLEKSFCLLAPPGYGKSYFLKQYIQELRKQNISFEILAPSHIAKLNLEDDDAMTVQKYFFTPNYMAKIKLCSTKIIIIDEISQVSRQYLKKLNICKKYDVHICLVGDFNQLPAVECDNEDYNYFESDLIKSLCNCTYYEFKNYHRGDLKLLEILNKIKNNEKKIEWSMFGNKRCKLNICYTNDKRKKINQEYMEKEKGSKNIFLKKYEKSDYSQDMYVYPTLPVICYKNSTTSYLTNQEHKGKIYNNEKFDIKRINVIKDKKEYIEISNGEISYFIETCKFTSLFVPSYCMTTHKVQGATLNEEFSIHEMDKMKCDNKLLYTAVSRAKSISQVNLIW
jgi:undecaprenyl pyrophosphate synthase